ncbi:MAG: hypothetical protein JW889_13845 [Verrucomicrobia bacterium]|nr:hypothetical protein [Verrucomicrobiota bacterium]
MGKVVLVLWIAVVLFAGFWFGYYQEGANRDITLEYVIKDTKGKQVPVDLSATVHISGDKLAVFFEVDATNFRGGGVQLKAKKMKGRIAFDFGKHEVFFFDDTHKKYKNVSLELVDTADCGTRPEFVLAGDSAKRTPGGREVLGFRCHAVSEKGAPVESWYTYELAYGRDITRLFNKFQRVKLPGLSDDENKKRMIATSPSYFPMPLSVASDKADSTRSLDVVSIRRDTISKDVWKDAFDVPSGYDKDDNLEQLPTAMLLMVLISLSGA